MGNNILYMRLTQSNGEASLPSMESEQCYFKTPQVWCGAMIQEPGSEMLFTEVEIKVSFIAQAPSK